MKKCIYTVLTGDYDIYHNAPIYKDWDCIMFTDKEINPKGWQVRKIKTDNPLKAHRDIKIRSHIHLSNYDLVCYVDANQVIIQEPPSYPIWFLHPKRDNIYDESKAIIIQNKAPKDLVHNQIQNYIDNNYKNKGLYMNGFFVRRHTEKINTLHDVWFKETIKYSQRDQLSLPYAIYKTNIYPDNIVKGIKRFEYSHIKNK